MSEPFPFQDNSTNGLLRSLKSHLLYSLAKTWDSRDNRDLAQALALALRDRLVEGMLATRERYRQSRAKRMYYFSIEFLLGRCLGNNLNNMGLQDLCGDLFKDLGANLEHIEEEERDPSLGNGGLGRLAACFLESLATLDMPGCGYGIHYEFGLFRQVIESGRQKELPDNWRSEGMPLQIKRADQAVMVPLYGHVEFAPGSDGRMRPLWLDWKDIIGMPYDIPIVGFGGKTVNYLRLYAAQASTSFDMDIFNQGDYIHAIEQKIKSEIVSKVLYPNESISFGRELRLVQEYFLVACALRDILRRFRQLNDDLLQFPEFVAIQLNDTHPTLAVAELMRLLVDEHHLPWEEAWEATWRTFAYTNHTLLPEALETWPVGLLERVLPRHLQIIYEINRRFLDQVAALHPGDTGKLTRMSLIEEGGERRVRMANLAVVGSHSVNGVSALHSELVRERLFPDFAALWPEKFNNKTNGVTPRRWLHLCNRPLAGLIDEAIGPDWVTDLSRLRQLEPLAEDAGFRERFARAKRANKQALAQYIAARQDLVVSPDSIFDIQAKRIHEYKRQLLNVLHIIHQYLAVVEDGIFPVWPKTYIFAGKAAPGYFEAKEIIHLIHRVAWVVNADPRADPFLKVAFLPDYRVTLAEKIIPAADVSEQISTAGTEASGTGNMKFGLNGALTVGTLDGANIEMMEEVGEENIYIFGLKTPEVAEMLGRGAYNPRDFLTRSPGLARVLEALATGRFTPGEPDLFRWVSDKLLAMNERYCHLADFADYARAQARLAADYANPAVWMKKAVLNTARLGKFSSDRTIQEYAKDIWGIRPVPAGPGESGDEPAKIQGRPQKGSPASKRKKKK